MPYLLVFSVAFSWLVYLVGYHAGISLGLAAVLVLGSVIGKKSIRVLQLHGLTLVLMSALALLGGLGGRDPRSLQLESAFLAGAYFFLALHSMTEARRCLKVVYVVIFWIGVTAGLAHAAGHRLGAWGTVLSIVLIAGVAAQDVRKLKQGSDDTN